MPIEFKDTAEAIAAVTTAVLAADAIGDFAERDYLYAGMRRFDVFKNYDTPKFNRLFGDVNKMIYDKLPCKSGMLTPQGLDVLFEAAKKKLNPDLRQRTFELAVGLASSDGVAEAETRVLDQLQKVFEISDDGASWKRAA